MGQGSDINQQARNVYQFIQKAGICPDRKALIIFEPTDRLLGVEVHVYGEDGVCDCADGNKTHQNKVDLDTYASESVIANRTRVFYNEN